MKKPVALSIESDVLENAKLYAKQYGLSLSAIVEAHLRMLPNLATRKTIFDLVEEFGPSNIDPKADLKELYYKDPKHGG